MDNFILDMTKNYYAKFLYFADKTSFIRTEINILFKIQTKEDTEQFIQKSSILQIKEKEMLIDCLYLNEQDLNNAKQTVVNFLNIDLFFDKINEPILLNNILPFNYTNNIIIEKSLFKETNDFHELRKQLKNIELFLNENKGNTALTNLSIILLNNETNSGLYNKKTNIITLKTNHLNPSSLYHEFFHLIDNELSIKYGTEGLFSNYKLVKEIKDLNLYQKYIHNLDTYIETKNFGKNNFILYYKKYLGQDFEKEIKNADNLIDKIKNMKFLEFNIGIHKDKVDKINELANELMEHINYANQIKNMPKRNLYAVYSDLIDLDRSHKHSYISKKSEKIARIYQSNFPSDKESMFPLGEEKEKLSSELLFILKNEIKPLISNNKTLSNIIALREKFNSNISKGFKNGI